MDLNRKYLMLHKMYNHEIFIKNNNNSFDEYISIREFDLNDNTIILIKLFLLKLFDLSII